MSFVKNVLTELEYQGKTQSELANAVGIKKSAISMWIARDSVPAADVALRVADFLGVPLSYLVTGERGEAAPTLRDVYPRLTGDMAQDVGFIADIYPDITGTDRSYIMGAARTAEKNIARKDGDCARDA